MKLNLTVPINNNKKEKLKKKKKKMKEKRKPAMYFSLKSLVCQK
jgi:hypothetical protein